MNDLGKISKFEFILTIGSICMYQLWVYVDYEVGLDVDYVLGDAY